MNTAGGVQRVAIENYPFTAALARKDGREIIVNGRSSTEGNSLCSVFSL